VWADLVRQALDEVARLELLTPVDCPVCGAGYPPPQVAVRRYGPRG
jgi:hypothetical protein